MIPSFFVQLDKLPFTANGKLDRRALPEPDGSMATGTVYEAPRSELEAGLVELWKAILKVEKVGIQDNFFTLGGHSLRAMTLVSRIHKAFQAEVPLREVFRRPTIAELAAYMEGADRSAFVEIKPTTEMLFVD
jgi:acyl carrier protein